MAVKRSQSASRVLSALETIAGHQPIGVSALARLMEADKSAVQRAIMTLADEGWIRIAPGTPTRWELTPHILAVAHLPHSTNDLRQRARAALESLRDNVGETVLLSVPDIHHFVVIDALESRHLLRMVMPAGTLAPVRNSASGRAFLPYLAPEARRELLGEEPDQALLEDFALCRERGYSISGGDIASGTTSLAAPIFELNGDPVGVVVVTGPSDRITPDHHPHVGTLVAETARSISRGTPRAVA